MRIGAVNAASGSAYAEFGNTKVWLESESFNDRPAPPRWKGTCETNTSAPVKCNRKGQARVADELQQQHPEREVTRCEIFIKTHYKKDGTATSHHVDGKKKKEKKWDFDIKELGEMEMQWEEKEATVALSHVYLCMEDGYVTTCKACHLHISLFWF